MAVLIVQKMTCLSVVEVAVEGTKARPEVDGGTKAEEGALFAIAMAATAAVETVNRTIFMLALVFAWDSVDSLNYERTVLIQLHSVISSRIVKMAADVSILASSNNSLF